MALNFTSSTHKVNHGSDLSLEDLTTATYLFWLYPTSLSFCWVSQKGGGGTGYRILLMSDVSAGDLVLAVDRTAALAVVTPAGVLSTGSWQFVAGVHDTGGIDTDQKIFVGSLTSVVAETSYTTQTVGSGAVTSNASIDQIIGNSVSDVNFPGRIAFTGIWNRVLSLGEIQAQQFHPHVTSGCVLFTHYGFNGTGTQADLSGNGNNGTVTGASVADHVPLGPAFGFDMDFSSYEIRRRRFHLRSTLLGGGLVSGGI